MQVFTSELDGTVKVVVPDGACFTLSVVEADGTREVIDAYDPAALVALGADAPDAPAPAGSGATLLELEVSDSVRVFHNGLGLTREQVASRVFHAVTRALELALAHAEDAAAR